MDGGVGEDERCGVVGQVICTHRCNLSVCFVGLAYGDVGEGVGGA